MNDFNHRMCKHVPGYKWCYWRWFYINRWVFAKIFEIKNGYDYRDCWSLDYAMAKWISPRLRHLAKNSCGCPCSYGMSKEEQETTPIDKWNPDSEKWISDINRCAQFFEDLVAHEDGDWHEGYNNEENRLQSEQMWVFTWMGEWYSGLWD